MPIQLRAKIRAVKNLALTEKYKISSGLHINVSEYALNTGQNHSLKNIFLKFRNNKKAPQSLLGAFLQNLVGRTTGLEPATTRITIWDSTN